MQVNVVLQRASDEWQVEVLVPSPSAQMLNQQDMPLLRTPRRLRRLVDPDDEDRAYPLPPQDEVDRLPAGALHRDLCRATDAALLRDAYSRIIQWRPGDDGMEKFGRYLFATLLGDDLWRRIQDEAAARAEGIELALCWAETEPDLYRLPWEAMHGPDLFLVQEPRFSITRRVIDTQVPQEIVIETPPRVLFVVGTSWNDRLIKHGAEHLGFPWCMRHAHLGLHHRVLHQPSPRLLQSMITAFQPAVIHFICPISAEPGDWALHLSQKGGQAAVKANELLTLLRHRDTQEFPPIVVLTACHNPAADDDLPPNVAQVAPVLVEERQLMGVGQCATPLAAALIRGGIPVVACLTGAAIHQACRLYTWRFYKALLHEGTIDLAREAALGRRAGLPRADAERGAAPIVHSGKYPWTVVDWAMSMLWMADGDVKVRVALQEKQGTWHRIATEKFEKSPSPDPVFCGRIEMFEQYDLLMSSFDFQRQVHGRELQALAISVRRSDDDEGLKLQYGRTRLLEEFALEAVRDGHIPLLLVEKAVKAQNMPWPKKDDELINCLRLVASATGRKFRDAGASLRFLGELDRMDKQNDLRLPNELRDVEELANAYSAVNDPKNEEVRAIALRHDLLAYLQVLRGRDVRKGGGPDVFAGDERGMAELLRRLGREHPRYQEALIYQARLTENLAYTRLYGSKRDLEATRNEIRGNLNQLAEAGLGVSFNALAEAAQEPIEAPLRDKSRLLLLIDDVHRMGYAAFFLLKNLLSQDNLDIWGDDVRIVLTYSTDREDCDLPLVRTEIEQWVKNRARTTPTRLTKFQNPIEEHLAYEHYLLNWQDENRRLRLTPVLENTRGMQVLFTKLKRMVKGIPGYLAGREVRGLVTGFIVEEEDEESQITVLRPIDDEEALGGVV